ncbi:Sec-independent protein translocase subunit TatA [Rhodococcus sp. ABRD24]|uniref:Sec-independent protein translocase subunit TatA n=1 Tax=Rhodococcus sp. ABRD24 TaxID=2507582 RepID=UPI00103A7B7E|nr:Sec-independent protein translocase subunit TatA [Rhodococcus sp. ABRD24]QBJ94554.1 Sec-independent protein translocase subunit TatA [Rhodococcus sp. ABRD24]
MGAMSPWHWAIVALVVIILFGSKKLPDAARGLGRSLRIFKSEVKEMQNDGNASASAAPTAAPATQLPSPAIDATVVESPKSHTEPKSA